MRIARRDFIATLGSAAAAPLLRPCAARAQQPGGMRRIGQLVSGAQDDPDIQARMAAFRHGLEQLGWSEGRNIRIDTRFGDGSPERYPALAKELVALQPEVILAYTTPITIALQRESHTIPIIFVSVSDPIGSKLVTSLARPGANITGFLLYEDSIVSKWLAMLKEIAPALTRVALMANPGTTPFDYFVRSAKAVAPSLAIEVTPSPTTGAADIESTIESFARAPNGGLVVLPDGTSLLHRDLVITLAARHRLPAVYVFRLFVTGGGLMSFGTDAVDMCRQAASYVDRILRGAKPAELPVQAPTKYETALNLKTAKALGLEVPPSLLVRADEVIE